VFTSLQNSPKLFKKKCNYVSGHKILRGLKQFNKTLQLCNNLKKTSIIILKVERVSVLNFKASLNLLGYNICKRKLFIYLKTIVIFTLSNLLSKNQLFKESRFFRKIFQPIISLKFFSPKMIISDLQFCSRSDEEVNKVNF
jgi:hypothetical protein